MTAYIAKTKNPTYAGKTYGVQFTRGRAIVSDETLDPFLGLTVEEVAERMAREFKYEVVPLDVDGKLQDPLPTEEAPEEPRKRTRKE